MDRLTINEAKRQYRSATARVLWAERKLKQVKRMKYAAWLEYMDALGRAERTGK